MSRRLSTSAIFQALTGRVAAMENTVQTGVFTTDVTAVVLRAPTIWANGSAGTGGIRLTRSYAVGQTGILEFLRSDGSRNGYVGFNADAGAVQYGSDVGAGHQFTGGPVTVGDGNFGLVPASSPQIIFDANDGLTFDRAANKFYFVIAGVNVASIDASGNMRLKGTLTQSVTP
ncbi:MAG TPA: hypothetical protein VNT42_05220 [Sphingomonas sp.]|nr:hypothetical protein [Sphingomonas sp.]